MTRFLVFLLFVVSAASLDPSSAKPDQHQILATFDSNPTGEEPWKEIQDRLTASVQNFVANGGKADSYDAIVVIIATLQVHYNESVTGFSADTLDRLKHLSYYFCHNLVAVAKYYFGGRYTKLGDAINDIKFQTTVINSYIWLHLAAGSISVTRYQTLACLAFAFFSVQTVDKPPHRHFYHGGRFVIPAVLLPAVQKVNAALGNHNVSGEDIKQLRGAEAIIEMIEKNKLPMDA